MTSNRFVKLKFDCYHFIGEGESLPIAKKLGFRNKEVFECIALHQDHNCVSDITIDQIADLTGIGRNTVIKAVKELEEFTYEGRHILEVQQFYSKERKKNVYKILPNYLVSYYNEKEIYSPKIEPLNEVYSPKIGLLEPVYSPKIGLTKESKNKEITNKNMEDNSMRTMKNKEVILLFCEAYKQKTMNEYKVVWSRDNKFTTKFLKTVEDLKNNEIKQLVEIIVDNYEAWSSNTAKYPLTVNTLSVEWVQERARKLLNQEKEAESQLVTETVEATKRTQVGIDSIMSRIKKGGKKE